MTEEFVEDILAEVTPIEKPVTEKTIEKDITKDVSLETTNKDIENKDIENKDNVPINETVESLATKLGWNPEHKGENYIDAATFILKSREIQDTMKDHNRDLKSQLSTVQGSIEALKEHNERVYKAEIRKIQGEIDYLKEQKLKAIELADVKEVNKIDVQIESLQKDLIVPIKNQPQKENPVFDDWIKDNQWYLTDDAMANYAESVAQQYLGAPLDRIYKMVRQKVAEVFPEKFEPLKKDNTTVLSKKNENLEDLANKESKKVIGPSSPVESARKTRGNKINFTKADLTPDQVSIMNQFVKSGVMTEEQYLSDIAKMQGE